jgi:Tol biopolymer transport system component
MSWLGRKMISRQFGWRRLFGVLLLALVVSVGIAGCSSGSATPGPTPTPTPIPTPTPTPNPTPTVTTLSPNSATMGGLAFTLAVHGSNFVPASTVQWSGNSRTTTFVNSSQLQAHIMAADLATKGTVAITVVNPAPGGGTSNGVNFTIPADTITFQSARALNGTDAANTNSTSNVWIVNADGSGAAPVTTLTVANGFSLNPVWSRDGRKITFRSQRALDGSDALLLSQASNLWVVNADGSGLTPLTKLTVNAASCFSPAWSPDGSKVSFGSGRALDGTDIANANATSNIWVMNADGSSPTPLTRLTAFPTDSVGPAWSPDGGKIAFRSFRALNGSDAANTNLTSNIWVMNADGSSPTPLTRLTATFSSSQDHAWSPDGSKIVFASQRALDGSDASNTNVTVNIWVVNADGSGTTALTKLTALGANSGTPVWSRDGSKIAFRSVRALNGSDAANTNAIANIWVMNADGSSPTPLTKLTAANASSQNPVWTPDGNKIFFDSARALDGSDAANTNATTNIWVVNADGSSPTPLTKLTATQAVSVLPKQP